MLRFAKSFKPFLGSRAFEIADDAGREAFRHDADCLELSNTNDSAESFDSVDDDAHESVGNLRSATADDGPRQCRASVLSELRSRIRQRTDDVSQATPL
jgi:hypothetical protein